MSRCTNCGSYAINHLAHGRDGSKPGLCDVCYWRNSADQLRTELAALKAGQGEAVELLSEMVDLHERRGVVLTVHMEELRALLAQMQEVKS